MHSTKQLELVRALAEHRNFGRAATALGVSQPSLTRSLKHLEEDLGAPLFDRAGVAPTVFGEIVLKHGRPVLAGFAELKREIALMQGLDVGELSVAMAFYPADVSGHEAAAELSRRHPNLALDLRIADWMRAKDNVLAGQSELAFADIRAAAASPDFDTEAVRSGPVTFFCAASHPLAKRARVDLADLMGCPWVGPAFPPELSIGMPKTEQACGAFDKASGLFHPRILVESFASAKRIVQLSEALSAGFPFQIARELAAGELALLTIDPPFVQLDYGFVTRRGRALSPAARAFMKAVREVERRLSG